MLALSPLSLSEKCKARGFTVIVDGRRSQWTTVKTVVLMLQVETCDMFGSDVYDCIAPPGR